MRERRQYIRLDSVFPVEFQLISPDTKFAFSEWLQGFTNNIGKGGLCLEVNNLRPQLAKLLEAHKAKLSLKIEMPLGRGIIDAIGIVSWIKETPGALDKYSLGLSYEEIDPKQNNRLIHYALARRLFAPLAISAILILGLTLALNSYINMKLIKGNKALVGQLISIVQESSVAKQKIKIINKEKEDLQLKIQALELEIETLAEEKKKIAEEKKLALQEQLILVQNKENTITEELLRLDKRKANLEKANIDKMYEWLLKHQNPRTGLVVSFEGDSDITGWAFTYDQALVAIAYTNFSDFSRAEKVLDFFARKAERTENRFLNAYYVNDGLPAEYTVHTGPNLWLGIAILRYTQKSKDKQFLGLAEEIASSALNLQSEDKEGGLRGGPKVEWCSTEHNLDAYAFFQMLYQVTEKGHYLAVAEKILTWLVSHTYDRPDVPVRRGKGDSTIATDTYAWSIAAMGPEKLEAAGLNPDGILEFAEKNCGVEVQYQRPEGQSIKVKGFDFAPQRHLARGSVVSAEWTAQMILAFKVMADFYYQKDMIAKARTYEAKADEYLSGLAKMVISSSSASGQGEICLPYATQECVDTGHGWITPKGKSTGSLAATVYAIFAYYNYNPLKLKE
ncbi:MAG: PilZ domain-containing protein [Candidatus Omnitrophica bacterium]|nr:PilZ domain-containing protein [Candidatus Omnitrophota bacterium]